LTKICLRLSFNTFSIFAISLQKEDRKINWTLRLGSKTDLAVPSNLLVCQEKKFCDIEHSSKEYLKRRKILFLLGLAAGTGGLAIACSDNQRAENPHRQRRLPVQRIPATALENKSS